MQQDCSEYSELKVRPYFRIGEEIEGPKTIRLENVPLFRLPRYERLR